MPDFEWLEFVTNFFQFPNGVIQFLKLFLKLFGANHWDLIVKKHSSNRQHLSDLDLSVSLLRCLRQLDSRFQSLHVVWMVLVEFVDVITVCFQSHWIGIRRGVVEYVQLLWICSTVAGSKKN